MSNGAWHFLNSGAGHYDFNMAFDEALLEAMPELGRPVLRFYGWLEPAASFGYFQKYADVESLTALRPLVRRPTAGGIVPHARDWTYSLAFPTTHEWHRLPALESYRRVHEWIRAAFALMGEETELAPQPNKSVLGQCFEGYERYDLLWRGRKIAGAAQRRRRDGFLIQGSVQPPESVGPREAWQRAMLEIAERQSEGWEELTLERAPVERAQELASTKYSVRAYNQKR